MTEVNCAKCPRPVCNSPAWEEGPDNCPTKIKKGLIKRATEKCFSEELQEFARQASIQEGQGYAKVPFAPKGYSPIKSRLEEIVEFAIKMGYKKLGVAFCGGVTYEAGLLVPILENKGFEVVSVCCKCGSVPKEDLGIRDDEKVAPGRFEAMCHPIAQADILNDAHTDLNIMLCLCVGHDSLFLKQSQAPCTVFAVKDRVFGHNPVVALYQSKSYYRRILAKEIIPVTSTELKRL
ncbi:MAG: DUF1847 domain-containing protein [Chloroflexota bacterium]|nr:DUF1847 domain-containing protein [Chloroflexota bacterium]